MIDPDKHPAEWWKAFGDFHVAPAMTAEQLYRAIRARLRMEKQAAEDAEQALHDSIVNDLDPQ